MSEVTPGPWKVDRDHRASLNIRGANGLPIAELWHTTDDIEANAALIASAPDLLDALNHIAQVCNGYGDEAGWACKRAREAIAKVRS